MNNDQIRNASELIQKSNYLVVVTGAGVSADSGIPPFRGHGGLWEKYDPKIYAEIRSFINHPGQSWVFFLELIELLNESIPNRAHFILFDLEKRGFLKHVITQNIDGLHQAAGQMQVVEIHGSLRNLTCLKCARKYSSKGMILDTEDLPPVCSCGGVLKPDTVLFGEPIPQEPYFAALEQIRLADVVIFIGTSGLVHPVNEFPEIASRHGAQIIEINIERTVLTDTHNTLHLQGSAIQILESILENISAMD